MKAWLLISYDGPGQTWQVQGEYDHLADAEAAKKMNEREHGGTWAIVCNLR